MKKSLFILRLHKTSVNITVTSLTSLLLGLFFASLGKGHFIPLFFLLLFVLLSVFGTIVNVGSSEYHDKAKVTWKILRVIFSELNLSRESARITIHYIKKANRERYLQLTPYYPTGGGQGREFAFTQGITGHVFRTMCAGRYSIPEGKSLAESHIEHWNFTQREILQLNQDRRSYFAYPIGSYGDYADIVIYADSSEQDYFNDEFYSNIVGKLDTVYKPILLAIFDIETSE